jgi:hypothetical protein
MSTAEHTQLPLITFEDQVVNRIVVKFAGSIELDMHDEEDRAYFDRLRLGKRVSVHATGKVTARPQTLNDAKGDVISAATITVDALLPESTFTLAGLAVAAMPAHDEATGEVIDFPTAQEAEEWDEPSDAEELAPSPEDVEP